jgi:hypothetical protein
MTTLYGSDAMVAYAREQIERAEVMLANHREATLRLCRCGRLHPCDERRYWHATKIHYRAIIDSR